MDIILVSLILAIYASFSVVLFGHLDLYTNFRFTLTPSSKRRNDGVPTPIVVIYEIKVVIDFHNSLTG